MTDDVTNLVNTTSSESRFQRGKRFVPQGVNGYDENWYPICLAKEVKPGKLHGFKYLNGKVIVFRTHDGKAQVLSAYCRHLGVDLSEGSVVGSTIRCPYHHWDYDQTGQCVKTAIGAEPPPRAKLFEFPTRESFGLIWAYNGEEPGYDLPVFPVPEHELEYIVCRASEVPMDPFMLFSNTMDLQHLISLHKAKFDSLPDKFEVGERTISYSQAMSMPKLGHSTQQVTCHGTNCITLVSEVKGRETFMMSAGLAIRGPLTKTFNVSATRRTEASTCGSVLSQMRERLAIRAHIKLVDAFGKRLNAEDDPIFRTMSPRMDRLAGNADKALKTYFDFATSYPRSTIAQDLICNDYRDGAQRIEVV
ncbi:Rieske 2Fe-2S domain-containing protein [Haliea sp.]